MKAARRIIIRSSCSRIDENEVDIDHVQWGMWSSAFIWNLLKRMMTILGGVHIVPHDTTIFLHEESFLFVPLSVEYFLSGYVFDDHYERDGGIVRFLLLTKAR